MKLSSRLSFLVPFLLPLLALSSPAPENADKKPPAKAPLKQITNSIGMKFSLVPAGVFIMGSPPSEPDRRENETPHEVEITRPFFIGIHEVTQREYYEIMGENPLYNDKKLLPETADCPATCVTWEDAMAFCKKLSERPAERKANRVYRLPTEAEWEYACRGGPGVKPQAYHFGATITAHQANFNGKGEDGPFLDGPTRVGSYSPNALGLFDMHGNVWEWCLDLYTEDYYKESPRKDPQGPDDGWMNVLRGGSCYNPGRATRSANRYRNASSAYCDAGFRVVFLSR